MILRTRSGFTLIELMAALGILSVMSVTLFYACNGITRSRDLLEEGADIQTMGRVAIGRVERELSLAFLSAAPSPTGEVTTRFLAEDNDPVDHVDFTSLSHERMVQDSKESDQTEIGYFEDDDPKSNHLMLMHREAPRIDGDPEKGGVVLPLARRVYRFNLRYFDQQSRKWFDDWDTEGADHAGRLPYMVSVELILMDDKEDEHPFRTRVFVRHNSPLGRD